MPLFPFHTWLPDAHVEAPTAGSVLLAGVLLKMGVYGLLRFNVGLFPDQARHHAVWINVLAIIGIIYGALVALVQPNMKKLVAYSSVSHLGFCVLGIFSFTQAGIDGSVYQMLNHGVSTGALFMLLGVLYDRRHTYEIKQYSGLATPMPQFATSVHVHPALLRRSAPVERLRRRIPDPQRRFAGQPVVRRLRHHRRHLDRVLSALALSAHLLRRGHDPRQLRHARLEPARRHRHLAAGSALAVIMGVASPLWIRNIDPAATHTLDMVRAGATPTTTAAIAEPTPK